MRKKGLKNNKKIRGKHGVTIDSVDLLPLIPILIFPVIDHKKKKKKKHKKTNTSDNNTKKNENDTRIKRKILEIAKKPR